MSSLRALVKVSALSGAGFVGWLAGKSHEQRQLFEKITDCENEDSNLLSNWSKPALPVFASVSAASPIVPAEGQGDMGSKLSVAESRVGQVI